MRKFMSVLVLMLPMFLFLSCSDDDSPNEYESQFVGQWVEDTDSEYEVYNIEFRSDGTGDQWLEFYGEVDESSKTPFVWSAAETTVTVSMTLNGVSQTSVLNYMIRDNKLYLSQGDETVVYVRR